MPVHDIIDNRTERLVDHLGQMLGSSERARFAVGYLFLSRLTSVAMRLLSLKELRLLTGNTSSRVGGGDVRAERALRIAFHPTY